MMGTRHSRPFLLLTLGFMVSLSPLITDMYLPSLPAMAESFETTPSMIQMSLMSSMLGLALGQLIIGPLSDKYGRRLPLLISLFLFIVSTVACIFSWDINSFVFFRMIQGAAGAGGMVISRSVSTDWFTGKELANVFSCIAAIMGFAPVGAPVIGGLLLEVTNWQGIFCVLLFLGVVLLTLCWRLTESLPHEHRSKHSAFATFRLFVPLLQNRRFMLYVLTLSFSMAAMFSYIASSPFIFQEFYGLSPFAFSVTFACNAVGITVGSVMASRFSKPEKGLWVGAMGLFVMGTASSVVLVCEAPFLAYESLLFAMLFFAGLTYPTSTTLALELERKNAGTASAVLGSVNFALGGLCSPLVGIGNILWSTAAMTILCSLIVLILPIIAHKIVRTSKEQKSNPHPQTSTHHSYPARIRPALCESTALNDPVNVNQ